MTAPLPNDEPDRLKTLQSYQVLDTPPEPAFDRLATLAARFFRVPIARVSLLDRERQWFKACVGGGQIRETPRSFSFCAYAILEDQVMVVPDAGADSRLKDNPAVTGEPHVRFYAGAPLRTPSGHNIGTFCIMDSLPRDLTATEQEMLADFAAMVVDELELRRTTIGLLQREAALRDARAAVERANRELESRVEQRTAELAQSQIEILTRLAHAAEFRDDDTGQHTRRVARTAELLALALGFSGERAGLLRQAAPLHDVGKIAVPDFILLKPGKLTVEEFEIVKTHAAAGAALLAGGSSEVVQLAECIAGSHHEKWNGLGYPKRLAGEEIPMEARIIAVADVFDALTHERPYKKAWPVPEAVEEIGRMAGRDFDPRVVEAFMSLPHEELLRDAEDEPSPCSKMQLMRNYFAQGQSQHPAEVS